MIICFSGTGNSRRVADFLQDALGEELIRFAPGHMLNPEKINIHVYDPRVIWVMPTHGWLMPKTVSKVIHEANLQMHGPVTHHLVLTCGDDMGYADRQWRTLMHIRGWKTASAHSVQMPNSYTCLPGFDVDAPEVVQAKLSAMPQRLEKVIADIESGEKIVDVVRGKFAWIKSKVIGPLFLKFFSSTKPFHATDACVGCGKCARNCPVICIEIVDGRPVWGKDCTMCLRCYHCCPRHAVAYGRHTANKGQYICPGYPLKP